MLYHVKHDHPNRQTEKGLGKEKGIPGKEERYWDNRTKRLPYMKKRKSVLIMRRRNQWMAGIMTDI
jgi:hypothetical protein